MAQIYTVDSVLIGSSITLISFYQYFSHWNSYTHETTITLSQNPNAIGSMINGDSRRSSQWTRWISYWNHEYDRYVLFCCHIPWWDVNCCSYCSFYYVFRVSQKSIRCSVSLIDLVMPSWEESLLFALLQMSAHEISGYRTNARPMCCWIGRNRDCQAVSRRPSYFRSTKMGWVMYYCLRSIIGRSSWMDSGDLLVLYLRTGCRMTDGHGIWMTIGSMEVQLFMTGMEMDWKRLFLSMIMVFCEFFKYSLLTSLSIVEWSSFNGICFYLCSPSYPYQSILVWDSFWSYKTSGYWAYYGYSWYLEDSCQRKW